MKTTLKSFALIMVITLMAGCSSQQCPLNFGYIETETELPSASEKNETDPQVDVSQNQTLVVESNVVTQTKPKNINKEGDVQVANNDEGNSESNTNSQEFAPKHESGSHSDLVKTRKNSIDQENGLSEELREKMNSHLTTKQQKKVEKKLNKRGSKLANKLAQKIEHASPKTTNDPIANLVYWILVVILILLILTLLRAVLGPLYPPLALLVLIILLGHIVGWW